MLNFFFYLAEEITTWDDARKLTDAQLERLGVNSMKKRNDIMEIFSSEKVEMQCYNIQDFGFDESESFAFHVPSSTSTKYHQVSLIILLYL